MTPLLIKSFRATAAVAAYLIVKASGDKTVAPATAATDALIGAADTLGADSGGMLDVTETGWGEVKAGGNVSFGDPLTADAQSRAVKAVPVAGSVVRIIGFARADGVANDIIPYLAAPGVLPTPAA